MTKRLDHVGVVVDDLEEAKRFLGEVLQLPLDREIDLSDTVGVLTAFYRCGDVDIDLLQPVTDDVRRQRLGEGVKARIEHIALELDDIRASMETLRRQGVQGATPKPV